MKISQYIAIISIVISLFLFPLLSRAEEAPEAPPCNLIELVETHDSDNENTEEQKVLSIDSNATLGESLIVWQ